MLKAFGLSDPGCVRANNEDYFINDAEAGIFILADGMGGANAGEYASKLSAEVTYECLLQTRSDTDSNCLEEAFFEANRAVRQAAKTKLQLDGMGTTLIVARMIDDHHLQISSVGDSRAYIVSNHVLTCLTEDQTWVAEVGSRLGLSDDALRKHPMRHVLTMAIGTVERLRIHSYTVRLEPGDQILLCSDGLHAVVGEKILLDTLNSEKNLDEKCHYLVDAAKQAGGPDNVTVVLIQLV
jgi:PPM family protein phosphatase